MSSLIVIGGSAGSLQPLLTIVSALSPGFRVPVLLVLHRNPSPRSPLEDVLKHRTSLQVKEIEEKDHLEEGCIHICPPDYHVLIEKDHTLSLDASEKVNFSRPSIDVVMRSASDVFAENLVCILLSGANADGAEGLLFAKARGARIIVQDPEEATTPFMPQEGLRIAGPALVLNAASIAGYLNSFVV